MTVYYKDYNLLRCRAHQLSSCALQFLEKGREEKKLQVHTGHSLQNKLQTYCKKRKRERRKEGNQKTIKTRWISGGGRFHTQVRKPGFSANQQEAEMLLWWSLSTYLFPTPFRGGHFGSLFLLDLSWSAHWLFCVQLHDSVLYTIKCRWFPHSV